MNNCNLLQRVRTSMIKGYSVTLATIRKACEIFNNLSGEPTCGWSHYDMNDECGYCNGKVGEVIRIFSEVLDET